ncbi:nucleotide exchange factor GrpE [Dactylosporangium aurantiacum]|uniref:Nucleotide exchange factor GrpE n=1 Tax=Dactylosporangium aurantiacum TaxID=35754 RepID=A0A9Q9I6A3_9ACTN|nr:nucleotide exchange factor GrpE [Dactylosporangium aurantiacum]MDG6106558.1 nucleotide exchange factor GrpE [Dactylosporangium aurantiacum]UWZ50414.1 nucleotide exchange factor GrpE [Dactylosporangium aurantiacum]
MFSSSNSLRLVAVAVALIVAVLTGVATGLISGAPDCPAVPAATTAATTAAPAPTTPAGGAGIGDSLGGGGAPEQPPKAQQTQAQPAGQVVRAAQPACTAQQPFGVTAAATAFVGALLVGAALLLLLLLSSRNAPRQVQVPAAAGRGNGAGPAEADRRALVQACIYVRDRVTSKALGDRLGTALQEAGVTTLEPTGARFDPAHHEAGGAAPSNDPALIGSIAAVEVPGYLDRDGRVLRAPIVTVYQAARNPGGPTGAHPTVAQPQQHTTSQQPRREQPR